MERRGLIEIVVMLTALRKTKPARTVEKLCRAVAERFARETGRDLNDVFGVADE